MIPDRRTWQVLIPVEHQPGRYRTISSSSIPTPDSACSLASQYPGAIVARDGFAARALQLLTSWYDCLPDDERAQVCALFDDHLPERFEPQRVVQSTKLDRQAKPLIDLAVWMGESQRTNLWVQDGRPPPVADWLGANLCCPADVEGVPDDVLITLTNTLAAARSSGLAEWPKPQPIINWLDRWFGARELTRQAWNHAVARQCICTLAVVGQMATDEDAAEQDITAALA